MGRHRRSAAGRAATGRATGGNEPHGPAVEGRTPQHSHPGHPAAPGTAPYGSPEAYAEAVSKSDAYLFAPDNVHAGARDTDPSGDTATFPATDGFGPDGSGADGFGPDGASRRGRSRRRKKKGMTPVRTGLLGVSAAVAIGTVAVATGVLPGGDTYTLGGGGSDKVQAGDTPTNAEAQQGGTSGTAEAGSSSPSTGRDAQRSTSASPSPSTPSTPSAKPTTEAPATKAPSKKPTATPSSQKPTPTPSRTPSKVPTQRTTPPVTISPETAAEAEVLKLVNDERAKAGCSPLAANSALAELAGNFSEAMAEQGFFDHTDPSGRTPWDRAEAAGITNLAAENIARGQADAAAVMESWMNSPGHRANILNCDFETLGVGVHYGSGGPWWTQNFGY